jgi:hypothetical protein
MSVIACCCGKSAFDGTVAPAFSCICGRVHERVAGVWEQCTEERGQALFVLNNLSQYLGHKKRWVLNHWSPIPRHVGAIQSTKEPKPWKT